MAPFYLLLCPPRVISKIAVTTGQSATISGITGTPAFNLEPQGATYSMKSFADQESYTLVFPPIPTPSSVPLRVQAWLKEKVRILPVQKLKNTLYYSQEMCRTLMVICSYSVFPEFYRNIFFESTLTFIWERSLTAFLFFSDESEFMN